MLSKDRFPGDMSRPVFVALLVIYSKLTLVLGGCLDCTECNGGDGQLNGLCKCDGNCDLFGDCCESVFDLSTCAVGNSDVPTGVESVCMSIYPDKRIQPQYLESFWMVSSCPSSWSDDEASVRDNCISLDSSFPPITNLDTGGVYANEYCAVCNGVENLIAWQQNLGCTMFVYEQIELLDYNITKLLEDDPTVFETQCQTCLYQTPNVSSYPRPCIPAVSTCLEKSKLEELARERYSIEHYENLTRDCMNGPYDIRTAQSANYRNNACAICNGEDSSTCIISPIQRSGVPNECIPPGNETTSMPPEIDSTAASPDVGGGGISPVSGIPFTIALSNLGEGQVVVTVQTETVTVKIECPEGQAALGLKCRPTLCPEGYVESGGQCAFVVKSISNANISVLQCLTTLVTLNSNVSYTLLVQSNQSVLYDGEVLTIVKFDSDGHPVVCLNNSFIEDSVNCPTKFVVLNETEYIKVSNNTVQSEGIVYKVVKFDAVGSAIVCPPNETTINETIVIYSYPSGYLELTYIGCSLSVIGSALVLLTYGLFKSLRTLPSLILMNLSAAILANNLFVLIGGPVTQAFPSIQLCATVAICLHFFFLAQFMWMSIMSFQMAKGFYQARKLIMVSSSEQKSSTMVVYFLIGWGIPLLIVAISIIVNFSTQNLVLYGVLDDGTLGSCWINHLESAIISFIIPLIVSMIINFTLFVIVTVFLCHSARSSTKVANTKNLPYFRVNVAVFSVTGLTWVFGFIALLAGTNWAWYPFIIFNSTQGFMIFITFLLTKRVLKLYWKFLLCRNDTVSSSTKRTNTHSPAGNKVIVNMNTQKINGKVDLISYTTKF